MKDKILLFFVLVFAVSQASAAGNEIHLKGNSFTPSESAPQVQQFSTQSQEKDHMLLQFKKPTNREYRKNLKEETGLEFISYIPENAWLIELNGNRNEIVSEKKVRYLGRYRPGHRIDPELEKEAAFSEGKVEIRVKLFEDGEKEVLSSYGELKDRFGPKTWKLETQYSEISKIARIENVQWVDPKAPKPKTFNDLSRQLIEVEKLQIEPYDLNGSGYTAAMWDAGIAGEHGDLNYTLSWPEVEDNKTIRGDNVDVNYHATHVAGTMLGGGNLDDTYRGMAPDGRLVSYLWPSNSSSRLVSETSDAVNNYDAVLSQNSWGWDLSSDDIDNEKRGDYGYLERYYDNLSKGYQGIEIPFIFAAGNEGGSYTPRYNTTVGPGATAKNTVTVGAVDDTADMTSYSSWGPTDDGRIKPTLVADGGCGDNSAIKSTLPGNIYDEVYGLNYICGTSMAAPAVSGAVILLNQQFNRTYDRLPSPATVKSSLIHNAEDLNRTGPDYVTGWGLVNATRTINYINNSQDQNLIQTGRINDTGDSENFSVTVPEGEPVRFTLVWSDYPGTSGSGKALINDLDLVVKDSDGNRKYPWTLSWENRAEVARKNREDHTNPVEQVYISSAGSKEYSVKVNGSNVPEPSQNFSLLMPAEASLIPEIDIVSPLNTSYRYHPDFNLSSNTSLSHAKFSIDGTGNFTMNEKNSTYFYNTSVSLLEGSHEAAFWANNSNDYWRSENVSFTVDTEPPSLNATGPVSDFNISGEFWINATWSDSISSIDRHEFEISNNTFNESGTLNTSYDSTSLEDGAYNLAYNVTDLAGNFNDTEIAVNIDNEDPAFLSFDPVSQDAFNQNFYVNATWKDNFTGVKTAEYEISNDTVQDSGNLNATVDISDLADGNYNVTYSLEDYAGNSISEEVEIFLDRAEPLLSVYKPSNNSYWNNSFNVSAHYSDNISGIGKANYTLLNESEQEKGAINSTLDVSDLSDDDYGINYTVEDRAGNLNYSKIDLTLDREEPDVNLTSPAENANISGNFTINATTSDSLSGINNSLYLIENSTFNTSGEINATINSTDLEDGGYNLSVKATDNAGNTNQTETSLQVDNTAPIIRSSTIEERANVSRIIDLNISFEEDSIIDTSRFRWFNSSGNQTSWKNLNYTGFNTSDLAEGSYNITVESNDTLGNERSENISYVRIDNTEPEISLVEYNTSEEVDGWINNSKTVEASCTDSGTGAEKVTAGDLVNTTIPGNLTLAETGNNSYVFSCLDYAGNEDKISKRFSIDAESPAITSLSPENESTTGRSADITLWFANESDQSGLNFSASKIKISSGSESFEWGNRSVNASITDLSYSQDYFLNGKLVDNLGHKTSFSLKYAVEEEPETDGGGSSSGSYSSPSSGSLLNEDEEETEEDDTVNQTSEVNETENYKNETVNECDRISAANPDTGECRMIDECEKPENWENVESCEVFEKEQEAEKLIEELDRTGRKEALKKAKEELEAGNYDKSINISSSALKENQEQNLQDYLIPAVILFATLLAAFLAVRFYRRRKIVKEVKNASGEVERAIQDGADVDEEKVEILAKLTEMIENRDFKQARKLFENSEEFE